MEHVDNIHTQSIRKSTCNINFTDLHVNQLNCMRTKWIGEGDNVQQLATTLTLGESEPCVCNAIIRSRFTHTFTRSQNENKKCAL